MKKANEDVPPFDYPTFKKEYPMEHRKIEDSIFDQVAAIYGTAKSGSGDVDLT